jgi:mRNA-degrading endonuclease RelE of RelBE toxin-antitoxin system
MIIIETSIFTKRIQEILANDEYRELQNFLVNNPAAGDIIKGSGGLRKVRWRGSGRGKRGGSRIIYYWIKSKNAILMLFVFNKNESARLTDSQLKSLKNIVEIELYEK